MFQHREIIDQIIDHVRDTPDGHFRASLKSCALVSKAWVARSQRHLFHHVKLQFETELKRWCKNITKERAKVLSTYVKWLGYSPPYKTKDPNALERFTYFTHVETLCIPKVDFGTFSNDGTSLRSAFGPFGNSVLYLVLDRCVGHFPTIINLFRLLPNITHLDALYCTLPYGTVMTSEQMFGEFETVKMLRVAGTERYFLNMLMPSRFINLKHISYFDKGPESPGTMRLLLTDCRKTVETLNVLTNHSLTITSDRKGFPEVYSLDTCKQLREIEFDHVHANKPNPEIAAVLPTIDSPHFETITFLAQNANVDFDFPSNKYWRRIDELLTMLGKHMAEEYQRELKVVFDGWKAPVEDEDARQRWRNLLPNFAQVGPIAFRRMGPPPRAHDPPIWHSLTREIVKEE